MSIRTQPALTSLLATCLLATIAEAQSVGTNYCTTIPNSTGAGAVMSASGSTDVNHGNLTLTTTSVPTGQLGLFFYGPQKLTNPFGAAYLCVGPGSTGIFRLKPPVSTGTNGIMNYALNFSAPPDPAGLIVNGSTWNFQAWFRDPAGNGTTSVLSDGLEIVFEETPPGFYDEMVSIPEGSFEMGRHVGSGSGDEYPVHTVDLGVNTNSDGYWMDQFEVTNAKFVTYLNNALSRGEITVVGGYMVYQNGGPGRLLCLVGTSPAWTRIDWDGVSFSARAGWENHPVAFVSWYGACAYANGRSRDLGLSPCYDESDWSCDFNAHGYRLPTEAEWEYAARGGANSPYTMFPWGDVINGSHANFDGSQDPFESNMQQTAPVGYYDGNQVPTGTNMANGYGLYDMSGNLSEWCWDRYSSTYYSSSPTLHPTGPTAGSDRVVRGGSWEPPTPRLETASRHRYPANWFLSGVGFRVVAKRLADH